MPYTYRSETGFPLYNLLSNRIEEYRAGRLSSERYEALNAIDMVWDKEDPWQVRYRLAKAYFEHHGTISGMPADYAPDGIWVSKWINEQKHIYRGNRPGKSLTDEQIHLLEDIGIVWQNASESIWNEHYEDAKVFYEHNGHLRVLSDSNKQLYRWVIKQRGAFHKGKLRKSQVERLNDIGMEW